MVYPAETPGDSRGCFEQGLYKLNGDSALCFQGAFGAITITSLRAAPVIAWMRGGWLLPDSLAAHAKGYSSFSAGGAESQGLFAASSAALHLSVVCRAAWDALRSQGLS